MKTVSFTVTPEDLQLLDRDTHWAVVPGTFDIMVGRSSADIQLKGTLEVRGPGGLSGYQWSVAAHAALRHPENMKMPSSAVWLIVPGEGRGRTSIPLRTRSAARVLPRSPLGRESTGRGRSISECSRSSLGALHRRKGPDSSPGPHGADPAPAARLARASDARLYPARHHDPVCCLQHPNRQSGWSVPPAPSQAGVCKVPKPVGATKVLPDLDIHLIVDNSSSHKSYPAQRWAAAFLTNPTRRSSSHVHGGEA